MNSNTRSCRACGLVDRSHGAKRGQSLAISREHVARGFSLLELMLAMAVFLVVSAAAFSLFNQQQLTTLTQRGQVGLNIALRNAASQLQMDLVNAGAGSLTGANIAAWPVGVSIVNNVVAPGTACNTPATFTYGANCFDQLNILAAVSPPHEPTPPTSAVAPSATSSPPTFAPTNTTDSTGGSGAGNCSNTSTGVAYVQAAAIPAPQTGSFTLAQTAAQFQTGDQLLLVTSQQRFYTTVVLTAAGQVSGSAVMLTFNPTNSNGSNSATNDPLNISTDSTDANNMLTDLFCGSDWALKLAPITYQVNISNTTDPRLMRTQYGVASAVMEQVVGFKVGATTWNNSTDTISTQYNYNAATYTNNVANDEAYNFTLVRSVRISLLARTAPSTNPILTFHNSFDGGAYQVQGVAVVVNPRNMSMNDL
jgi:prepilin-type N-terminal cleavage/methylation domain-containing protein